MTILYMYSPATREYTGSRMATVINGKAITKAAFATLVSPPDDIPEGSVAQWNGTSWDIVEDHRRKMDEHGVLYGGTPYWLPAEGDDYTTAARYMEELGPLPEGATTEMPTRVYTVDELKDEFLNKLSLDFDACMNSLAVVTSLGYTVNADPDAFMNVSGLLDAGVFPVAFMLYDNTTVQLSEEQLKTIKNNIFAARQAVYEKKWVVRDAINSATTTDDVLAIHWDRDLNLSTKKGVK